MSRFSDYKIQAATQNTPLIWKHELFDAAGELLATDQEDEAGTGAIEWSPTVDAMQFQSARVSQRTTTMRLPVTVDALLPSAPGSLLHPDSNNRVRSSAGILTSSGPKWWVQGTMLPSEVEADDDGSLAELTVTLVDVIDPVRSDMTGSFAWDDGDLVETVVARILSQVLDESSFSVSPTGCSMPSGSLSAGADRYEAVNDMLEGCGHELVASPLGFVSTRLILPTVDVPAAERWIYGASGIPVNARRVWRSRVPRGWKIEAGSFQDDESSISVVVYDTDPRSESYFSGPGNVSIETARYPYVRSVSQAVAAGYGQLRRNGSGPMSVELTTTPNPAIREGDLIDLEYPRLEASRTFRVIGYELPIQAEGLMSITARATYDPALNYEPSFDRGDGCLISILDSFVRSDQNLENRTDSAGSDPGSPDWTEVGNSWGVVDQKAVQRFNNGWSLAFVNTPMCSTEQSVTVVVSNAPAGKFVGPAVRSTGEFDGYLALADSAGTISLESWLNRARVSALGSHSSGSSVVGKSLSISAVGSLIEVSLDGQVVISVQDDSRSGPHVGMAALGGKGANAPSVESFQAETL